MKSLPWSVFPTCSCEGARACFGPRAAVGLKVPLEHCTSWTLSHRDVAINPKPEHSRDSSLTGDTPQNRIQEMVEEGADIIDIGGQSTRPGAEIVPLDQELSRVIPVISTARALGVTACISVDTFRAEVSGS